MKRGRPAFKTHHPQVLVEHGEWSAEVDENLAPLILELWRAGWATRQSCQRHGPTGKVWIEFLVSEDVERFLAAVAIPDSAPGSIWRRAQDWGFNCGVSAAGDWADDKSVAWEYHAQVWSPGQEEDLPLPPELSINVLFPRADLREVVDRLRTYNEAQAPGSRP